MPEIKKEYPEGQRSAEMVLVNMLIEKRSWADYMKIKQALCNLRFHAADLKKKYDTINQDDERKRSTL